VYTLNHKQKLQGEELWAYIDDEYGGQGWELVSAVPAFGWWHQGASTHLMLWVKRPVAPG